MKKLLYAIIIIVLFISIHAAEYVLLQTIEYGTGSSSWEVGPHTTDFNRNGIEEMLLNTVRSGEFSIQFYEYRNDSMELIHSINPGYFIWAGGWGDYDNDGMYEIVGAAPDSQFNFTMEQRDSANFPDTLNWQEYPDAGGYIFSTAKLKPDSIDRIVREGIYDDGFGWDQGWGYYESSGNNNYELADSARMNTEVFFLDFVDFDNDTLLDILMKINTTTTDSAMIIEEALSSSNDSFVPYKAYPIVDRSPSPTKICVLPDIDGDGEKEIGFTKQGTINPNPEYYFCIAEDTSGSGELVDILNVKNIVETDNVFLTGSGADYGDVNNDGKVEAVYSGGRLMQVWGCVGPDSFELEYSFTDPRMNLLRSTVKCYDYNLNGIPEIIFTGGGGEYTGRTYIIECRPLPKLDYNNPYDLGDKPIGTNVTDSLSLRAIDELPVVIDSLKLLKQRNNTLNEPSYPCSVPSYDSLPITFDIYSDTSVFITDTLIVYSNDWYGNIDTIEIYSGVGAQIVLDSAVAYDNRNEESGIDYDDCIKLYFNYPIDPPDTSTVNLDSILPLSNNHTWYDGTGSIKQINYLEDNRVMAIWFSTDTSIPTLQVGDTIKPDSISLQDKRNYSYLIENTIITGSFGPTGINSYPTIDHQPFTIDLTFNSIQIENNTDNTHTYQITDITGRIIKNIEAKKGITRYTPDKSGIYFILDNNNSVLGKSIIVR
ncbi:MAG: hypothetical protein SVK54_05115 [candidate division WOR-3 bacterium]|nr:hypothetical protein [candidate division WOR-3 bacterium]